MSRLSTFCLAIGLSFVGSAAAQGMGVPSMEERNEAFTEVNTAMVNGNKAAAADELITLTENPQWPTFHAEAYARLAVLLNQMDLPYSALAAYTKALEIDPEGVSSEVQKAVALADKVGDQAILEPVFAKNIGLTVDDATRSRMAYLAARENQRKGNLGVAGAMLQMVQAKDPYYPEAKSLEGVILALQGRHEAALTPLQIALATGSRAERGEQFKATVTLNLARAYYAAGNYPQASQYWSQIKRDDPKWLDAQFERAWAHFRMEDMNGVLALLQNHVSPYFQDRYYPEASMLRLYALFLLCKFPDASKQLEDFQAQYRPQQVELRVSTMSAPSLFEAVRRHIETGSSDLPAMITAPLTHEDRINNSINAILNAEQEMARLRNVNANTFAQSAMEWLTDRRGVLVQSEGDRILARATAMEAELNEMLSNSDVTKLDLMQMETRLLERASFTGKMPESKRRVKRQARARVTERLWDWQGEYWADEIGYYRIDTKPECPDGMRAGSAN
jgi:tetratricopeptide (TPR) repeat protein